MSQQWGTSAYLFLLNEMTDTCVCGFGKYWGIYSPLFCCGEMSFSVCTYTFQDALALILFHFNPFLAELHLGPQVFRSPTDLSCTCCMEQCQASIVLLQTFTLQTIRWGLLWIIHCTVHWCVFISSKAGHYCMVMQLFSSIIKKTLIQLKFSRGQINQAKNNAWTVNVAPQQLSPENK